MMNKTIIAVTTIVSISALLGWCLYLQNSRYHLVGTQKGIAYEVDRKTGITWTVYPGRKEINEESGKESNRNDLHRFSSSERALVTGNAELSYGSFSGKLYNGSEWTVKEVVFSVVAKESDDKVRWSRKFQHNLSIPPLSTKSFSVTVTGEKDVGSFNWGIIDVSGAKTK